MKDDDLSQDENQTPANESAPIAPGDLHQSGIDFVPFADEVARRAYFSYLNEGSRPGRDVQHWLEAEAQLLKERNLTRVHGFFHADGTD